MRTREPKLKAGSELCRDEGGFFQSFSGGLGFIGTCVPQKKSLGARVVLKASDVIKACVRAGFLLV